jgi:hypothetical protein
MIDVKERGGVVRDNMQRIQDFFLDPHTKDGALAIMPSPKGPSGLHTDDGKAIDYLTSFFFVMQKHGNEIVGSTIKTDFTNKEYRDIIKTLTGQELPIDASLQDYVRAVALVNPNERREGVNTPDDVVGLMKQTKLNARGDDSAFEGRAWDEIYRGIAKGEELYNFNVQTQQYVSDFMDYVGEGNHSRLELQKAVGATLLRISQIFLEKQNADFINSQLIATKDSVVSRATGPAVALSFGEVYTEVKKIGGCAGGGEDNSKTSVLSMGGMIGAEVNGFGSDKFGSRTFNCPDCGEMNVRPVNELVNNCQHCGSDKVGC